MEIKIFFTLLFIIVMWCNAIRITQDKHMIFEKIGDFFNDKPYFDFFSKPLFKCIQCMSFFHSGLVYWIAWNFWGIHFYVFVYIVLGCSAMFFNGVTRNLYILLNKV